MHVYSFSLCHFGGKILRKLYMLLLLLAINIFFLYL